jgi:HdeA/HdeB family
MKFIGTIVAAALLCGTAQAADKDTNYQVIGAGTIKCQTYLDANDTDRKFAEMWWTGYVTATNWLTADTWSIVGRDPNNRVNDAIQKQCKDHPTMMFVVAVHDAVQTLYDSNRMKAAPKN